MAPRRTVPHRLRQPWLVDALVAAGVVALGVRVLDGAGSGAGFREADDLAYVLTAVGCAAVGWGRRQPVAALAVASAAGTVLAVRDHHVDVLPFVVAVLLFAVASYRRRQEAVVGLAVAAGAFAVTVASRPADLPAVGVVQSCAIFGVAWALGRLTRSRRETLLALVRAAEQQATTARALAAVEVDRATLATAQERLLIARELHDVLAHSVSVISVQATVGEHLADADPAAARRALGTIGEVSRGTLRELRQILTLLRDGAAENLDETGPYAPARGLDDVEALAGTYRAAGLRVRTTLRGEQRPLPSSAQLCAYRIVQEALTNSLRHGGACTADVLLDHRPDALHVSVSDDGRGPLAPATVSGTAPPGHGLVGMRERTALLGGAFTAGRGPDGGFLVTATIPYEAR